MTLLVPNAGEVLALQRILNDGLRLKLYSNNITPGETDTAGTYTETTGGGYADKLLTFATWVITSGAPTFALYPAQYFFFSGVVGGTGNVYGYYVVSSIGTLLFAERFAAGVLPFTPIEGSFISITPRLEAA